MNVEDYLFQLNWMMTIEVDAEALNNEEAIGNVVKPRTITLRDGLARNAMSGAMVKRVFVKKLRGLCSPEELCPTCRIFSPMKNGEVEIDDNLSASGNRVKHCVICDATGFMNAGKQKNEKRFSTTKNSWAIAKQPGFSENAIYTRVDPTHEGGKEKKTKGERESEGNTNGDQNTQMLFYRPVRSSEYGIVFSIDLHRIGFDDEKQMYILSKEEIIHRIQLILTAVEQTFLDIEGAMMNVNHPHIRSIKGVVTEKTNRFQTALKISPLNEQYIEENLSASDVAYELPTISALMERTKAYKDTDFLKTLVTRNMNFIEQHFKEEEKTEEHEGKETKKRGKKK